MKPVKRIYLVSDRDRAAISALKATLAQIEGAAPKVDYQLHSLTRVGDSGIILVPDRGIMAPTSPNARPPTKRDLPWLPPEVVWVPSGEIARRKQDERGWTQARLSDVRTLASRAESITLVTSSDGAQHALDELAIELPSEVPLRSTSVPAGAHPTAVWDHLTKARKYSAPRAAITGRRSCLAIDYIASTNFRIGLSEKLREAKVGPMKGVRLTLIMIGVLGAVARIGESKDSGSLQWRREIIVRSEVGEEMLALDAVDPLPPDAPYREVIARKPASGVRATVIDDSSEEYQADPPSPLTLGGLVKAGIDPLQVQAAVDGLAAKGAIAHGFDGGRSYPAADRILLERMSAAFADGPHRLLVERALQRADLPDWPAAGRYAITPLPSPLPADVTAAEQEVHEVVLRRWLEQFAGPVRVVRRRIVVQAGGLPYATWVYAEVKNAGWSLKTPPVCSPTSWRSGSGVRVVEAIVEPRFARAESLGDLLDALSLAWRTSPWERERVPGAVLATPRSVLNALAMLAEQELISLDKDRAHLTALGKQVLAFMPAELRHPAWVSNVRTLAQRASDDGARRMVRGDLDDAIVRYADRLARVTVTLSPRIWTAEESEPTGAPGANGGRAGLDRQVERTAG